MVASLVFVLSFLCCAAICFYLFSILAVQSFVLRTKNQEIPFTPSVAILKPTCGLDPETYENLVSFCRQDYPSYQIIFGVNDENDPAVPVIQDILREFPNLQAELVISRKRCGANPKVSNLIQMHERAAYSFLVLSDGDVRVEPDYLKRIMAPLRDARVGAVTALCRSMATGWVARLEALRIATEFSPGVFVSRFIGGIQFGLGSTIAVRPEAFEAVGGFPSIADYLADDFQLGNQIARKGFRVILSDYIASHTLAAKSFIELIRRQVRWARGMHLSHPWGYRGLIVTYGVPMSFFLLLLTRGSALGWSILVLTWGMRFLMAWRVGVRSLRDETASRFLWAVPLSDWISFIVWVYGFFGDAIIWRGQRFRLDKTGRLIPRDSCQNFPDPFITRMARPLVPWFIRCKISANSITGFSLAVGILGGLFFFCGEKSPMLIVGAVGFLLANLLDECDGKVARATGTSSSFGAFLDTVSDCIVHMALFLGLGIGLWQQSGHSYWFTLGMIAAGGGFLSLLLDISGITPWHSPAASSASEFNLLGQLTEWLRIDFSILVFVSALCHRMEWLLWAGALGVFLFWIPSTVLMTVRSRRVQP